MFNVSELINAKVNALLSDARLESMIADAIGKELEKVSAKVDDIISDAVAEMTSDIADKLESSVRDRVESIASDYDYTDAVDEWVEDNVSESDVEYEIDFRVKSVLDSSYIYIDDYISNAVESIVIVYDDDIQNKVESYIDAEYDVEQMVNDALEARIAKMCESADVTPKADTPAADAEAEADEIEAEMDTVIQRNEHYSVTVYTKADDEYLFPTSAMAMAFYDEKVDAGIPVGLVEHYTTPNAIWMWADKPTNSAELRKLNDRD